MLTVSKFKGFTSLFMANLKYKEAYYVLCTIKKCMPAGFNDCNKISIRCWHNVLCLNVVMSHHWIQSPEHL